MRSRVRTFVGIVVLSLVLLLPETARAQIIPGECETGFLPSGALRSYASVIHVSLCRLLFWLTAMCGFCGGRVRGTARAVAGAPL